MGEPKEVANQKESYKPKKGSRSPSYPGIDLKEALAKVRLIYEKEKEHPAPVDAILEHWSYKPKSGPGLVALAALKKYGLMADEGSGKDRQAELTNLALDIILDERESSQEQKEWIQTAAMNPEIHRELWDKYNGELPSDQSLKFYLIRQRGFTESGANDFIRQFRETIEFANLDESDSMSGKIGDENYVNAGDDVSFGLKESATIIPNAATMKHSTQGLTVQTGMNNDTITLKEGQVVLQWPSDMSQESYQDYKDWLALMARRAERAVIKEEPDKE